MTTQGSQYQAALKQIFGFDNFRQGQAEVVDGLLGGHSSLAIFPTGSGKSLCYQFAATQLPHLTLVVSPLLALIKDQLAFLDSKGIPAASIDSSLSKDQHQQVIQSVKDGHCKVLMISVERFKNERFRQFIQSVPISMLVIDEAHCISEWGHNFRPDYLKLPHYQAELAIPLTLLLTATATPQVKLDMAKRFSISPQHIVQTGFYRANLHLAVAPCDEQQRDSQLLEAIRQQAGAGIVYVTLQKTAESVARALQQQGISAKAYHAGLDNDTRTAIQQDFMANQVHVVVATIAFGMGIDKSDIRFVLHYDLPKSIENYSQEIGRAGRDGQPAYCGMLANLDGLRTVENFIYADTPDPSALNCVIEQIKQYQPEDSASGYFNWEVQLNTLSSATNIRSLPLKTLLVQMELLGVLTPLFSYFAEYKYRFLTPKQDVLALFDAPRADFLEAVFTASNMKRVWATLDFEGLPSQYRSERGRVIRALEYLDEQEHIQLETRLMTDVWQVNQQALRHPDLPQKLCDYFQQNEQKNIQRIQQMIAFFESPSCLNAQLSDYFGAAQDLQHCGHCSVCEGRVARLGYSQQAELPSRDDIRQWMNGFAQHVSGKYHQPLNETHYIRFLLGMAMPAFSRMRLSQVQGYAQCENNPYQEVQQLVAAELLPLSE